MDSLLWCVLKYYLNILSYRKASCDAGLDRERYDHQASCMYVCMHPLFYYSEVSEKAATDLKISTDNLSQCESDLSAAYILVISGINMGYSHHTLQGQ